MKNISLTFLGAAGTVTGSKTLLEYQGKKILVDCGLFQGLKDLRLKNWDSFPIDPQEIDEVIITHAHLDHCGYLPKLVKDGFNGPIHCTHPTQKLIKIILEDSAKIQEEEADRAARYGYSKHKKPQPLYKVADVDAVLNLIVPHNYSEWVIIEPRLKFQLHNAGHILGSAMIELEINDEKTIVFSGDLGTSDPLLLSTPKHIKKADFVVVESTYGDRLHPEQLAIEAVREAVLVSQEKNGILIIPTFAVERAQEIIFLLTQLKAAGDIPDIPIYLDSPMGINATEVFLDFPEWHAIGEQKCRDMCMSIHVVRDVAYSKEVLANDQPKIVLAGSGMISGGRILHYLAKYISNPEATVLLAGFQAEGTRGRQLQEGAHEIKFFGTWHKVKAEIIQTSTLSAHADQQDILEWLAKIKGVKKVLINHGEPNASHILELKIEDELNVAAEVAKPGKKTIL